MSLSVDVEFFNRHITYLYEDFKQHKATKYNNVDCLFVLYGRYFDDPQCAMAVKLQIWLFGLEFPEIAIIFTDSKVHILASKKKVDLLENNGKGITSKKDSQVQLTTRTENIDNDLSDFMKKCEGTIGIFSDDINNMKKGMKAGGKASSPGQFAIAAIKLLDTKTSADVSKAIEPVLLHLTKEEKSWMVKSGLNTATVMKSVIKKRIEKMHEITHDKLSQEAERYIKSLKNADPANIHAEACFLPIIQSGGNYNFSLNAESDDKNISFAPGSTIVIIIGTRYMKMGTCNGRTILINPSQDKQNVYNILHKAFDAAISACVKGNKIKDVYDAAKNTIADETFKQHFSKIAGYSIGIDYDPPFTEINSSNDLEITEGMHFGLRLAIEGLEEEGKKYSLFLADTVYVTDDTKPKVLTDQDLSREFTNISYEIDDEEETKPSVSKETMSLLTETGNRREKDTTQKTEEQRKQHQKELAKKKHEEQLARLSGKGGVEMEKRSTKKIDSYAEPELIPREAKPNRIFVDTANETLLLPVYGMMVPFHIATVKTATKHDDYLRVTFLTPGPNQAFGAGVYKMQMEALNNEALHFIKELTYYIPDAKLMNEHLRMIKELKKRVSQRETERVDRDSLVTQEKLKLDTSGKSVRLHHLIIRPNLGGKKDLGTLEAHVNGFRFKSNKGKIVDIIYNNIKHAFFQPAENEVIVLIHFRLHHPIMVGRKKTDDIQFCTEVIEASQALDNTKRKYGDADELQEEQREREMVAKLNKDFQKFVLKVEELTKGKIEFDMPYPNLKFQGVPFRSAVWLMPTLTCLIQLVETPFFILSLDDIERAHLERVQFNLKHFDLVFIPKDYDKPVLHINQIPVSSLDTLKQWMDESQIVYTEGPMNLNWNQIMKTVRADQKGFFEDGGWSFLEEESSDEEEEGEEEEDDEEFAPEDDEEEYDDEEDEDSYEYMSDKDDDEDSDEPEEEEEDEGLDWDELEEQAAKEDKKRGKTAKDEGEIDSEEENRKEARRRGTKRR